MHTHTNPSLEVESVSSEFGEEVLVERKEKRRKSWLFAKFMLVTFLYIGILASWLAIRHQKELLAVVEPETAEKIRKIVQPALRATPLPTPEPTPEPIPFETDTRHTLGIFTITIPAQRYLSTVHGEPVQVKTSQIQADENSCDFVSNIHHLFYQSAIRPEDDLYASWFSWTQSGQAFANEEREKSFVEGEANLTKLLDQPDGNLSIDTEGNYQPQHSIFCGGGWFVPVYKQTIQTSLVERAAYLEVNHGNGDAEQPPRRYLLAKHRNNWLIVSDESVATPSAELYDELYTKCVMENHEDTLGENIACAAEVWEKHRRPEEVQNWVEHILKQLSL